MMDVHLLNSFVDPLAAQQYNDNNGNIYSDAFWLSALIESVGELEFGQQVCKYSYFVLFKYKCIIMICLRFQST